MSFLMCLFWLILFQKKSRKWPKNANLGAISGVQNFFGTLQFLQLGEAETDN